MVIDHALQIGLRKTSHRVYLSSLRSLQLALAVRDFILILLLPSK
jgi:hypothetical protein